MAEFRDYKTLDVWKKACELSIQVYKLTQSFPKEELYGLVSQMRRCSVSIPSNIAEGIGRNYSKETIQFLAISRGSVFELETQAYISKDLCFINNEDYIVLFSLIEENKKLLNGFISYHKGKLVNSNSKSVSS